MKMFGNCQIIAAVINNMKKLLSIVVLLFLWSTKAYAPITPTPPPMFSVTEIAVIIFGIIFCVLIYSYYKNWEEQNYKSELISKEFKIKFYKRVYALSLITIVFFPPLSNYYTNRESFIGWDFISNLGGYTQIKISYLLLEIALITIVFLLFRKSK